MSSNYVCLFITSTNHCYLNKIHIFAGGVEADGMWQAVFVTFLVYSMMPLKTWVALTFSTIIAAAHMSVSALLTTNQKIGLHCFVYTRRRNKIFIDVW